mgnify:CR=1 FL=1
MTKRHLQDHYADYYAPRDLISATKVYEVLCVEDWNVEDNEPFHLALFTTKEAAETYLNEQKHCFSQQQDATDVDTTAKIDLYWIEERTVRGV